MTTAPENLYIFDGLSESEIAYFIMMSEKEEVPAGTKLIEQWAAADGKAYFIAKWKVHVTQSGRDVGYIGQGGFFGEIALMFDEPRTATVEVVEDSELLVFRKDEFLMLLKKSNDGTMQQEVMRRIQQNIRSNVSRI